MPDTGMVCLNGIFGSRSSAGTGQVLINTEPLGHAESGQSTMTHSRVVRSTQPGLKSCAGGGVALRSTKWVSAIYSDRKAFADQLDRWLAQNRAR
jgi:hypothetical protein